MRYIFQIFLILSSFLSAEIESSTLIIDGTKTNTLILNDETFIELPQSKSEGLDLSALIIDGIEENAIFIMREGNETFLEKDVLKNIPEIIVSEENNTITTPIGVAKLSDLFKGKDYFKVSDLDKVLKIRGEYSEENIALYLQTPWRHLRGRKGKTNKVADIFPETNIINGIRLDIDTAYQNDEFIHKEELQLSGRIMDGLSRISLLKVNKKDAYINELFWLKTEKRYNLLFGLQNTQSHQLLPYQQMTGAQAIWTNYDMSEISSQVESTLRPSLGPDNRIIKGKGPIGGSVVLMVNDSAKLVERIRLDGTYRMDVSQQNISNSPLIELWIYERDPIGAPIEKHNLNYLRLSTLLAKGQFSVLSGIGKGGNIFDINNKREHNSTVANIYFRYGFSDTLTFEGGLMQDEYNRQYSIIGATTALTDNLRLHTAVSAQKDLISTYTTLNGQWDDDYLTLTWQNEPKGYRGITLDKKDGYLDYMMKMNEKLYLGVNGRYYNNNDKNVSFILPSVRYQALDSLSLTLIPNYKGKYRFTATYIPDSDLRFNYIFEEDEHRLSVTKKIDDEWNLYFDGLNDFKDKSRYEVGTSWRSENYEDIYFEAGAIYSESEIGFKASMRHNLLPGVYAKYEARHEPYLTNESKSYFFINIIADFGILDGEFKPTQAPEGNRNMRGYMAGNIYINNTDKHIDSSDINILINNSSIKGGTSKGQFYIEDLKENIYTVELDSSSLPMEYTPVKSSYNVKISDGAVSKVDFYVDVFYGLAGELKGLKSKDSIKVILISEKDKKEFISYTDRFNYYRFDGLSPGTYTLSIVDDNLKSNTKKVIIKNDFIFDQNLRIIK